MNAQLQGNITFDQVLSQPAYQKLDAPKKYEVAQDFFSKHVASQPAYQTLKPEQQDEIFQVFQVKYKLRPIEAPQPLQLDLPRIPTPQAMPPPEIPQIAPDSLPFYDNTQIRAQADFSPLQNAQAGIGGALGGLFKGVLPVEQIDNPLPVGPQDLSSLYNTNPVGRMAETATRVPTSFISNALAAIPTGGAYNAAYGAISQAEQNRLAQEQALRQLDVEAVKRLIGAALPASVTGGITGLLSAKVPLFLGKGLPARVATGASLGYAGDMASSAQQQYATTGQLDPSTLDYRPNVGTLIGTAGGVAPEALRAGRQLLGRVQQLEMPKLPELPSFGRGQQNDRPISVKQMRYDQQGYVRTKSGKVNFGYFPAEIADELGLPDGPIRLLQKDLDHILEGHAKEFNKAGIKQPIRFIESVVQNFVEVRNGTGKSLILVKRYPKVGIAFIELKRPQGHERFYRVKSAFLGTEGAKTLNRELLWKGRPDPSSVPETLETTLQGQPAKSQSGKPLRRSGQNSNEKLKSKSPPSQNSMPSEASLPTSKPVKKQEMQKDSRREQAEKLVQAKTIKSEVNPSVTPKTDKGKKLDSVVKAYQETTDPMMQVELAGQVDELARSMPKEEFVQVMKQLSQEQLDEIGKEVGC
jgi:hypothetical protein